MLDGVIRHATAIGTHARRMTEDSGPAIRYRPTRHEQQRALVLPPGPAIPGIGLVLLVARAGPPDEGAASRIRKARNAARVALASGAFAGARSTLPRPRPERVQPSTCLATKARGAIASTVPIDRGAASATPQRRMPYRPLGLLGARAARPKGRGDTPPSQTIATEPLRRTQRLRAAAMARAGHRCSARVTACSVPRDHARRLEGSATAASRQRWQSSLALLEDKSRNT